MDPEQAHRFGFWAIRWGRFLSMALIRQTREPRTVMGLEFPNAFGLAAGFDKNARGPLALLALGFGHVEIGTVTGHPQPGNLQPRLFRLIDDRCVINRMGFNNDGAEVIARRLRKLRSGRRGRQAVIAVNIGRTKRIAPEDAIHDYLASATALAPYASYLVVNVSSPNTPGLRDLQAVTELRPLLMAVRAVCEAAVGGRVPLVVKIAPDLADRDVDAIVDLAVEIGLDGICAVNTTIIRPEALRADREVIAQIGAGGLSGPVLASRGMEVLRNIVRRADGRLAVISVGGVESPEDLRARLDAGADLVQGYTAFIYEGPLWPSRMAAQSVKP